MGLFGGFKKKKDEFNTNPDLGMPLQGQDQEQQFPPFDQGSGFQQDAFSNQPGQQFPGFNEQPAQQPPQDYGWEKIPPGPTGYPRGASSNIDDIKTNKEFELINAKLDSIKSELDSVNQRLKRMERIAEGSGTPGKHDAWY